MGQIQEGRLAAGEQSIRKAHTLLFFISQPHFDIIPFPSIPFSRPREDARSIELRATGSGWSIKLQATS